MHPVTAFRVADQPCETVQRLMFVKYVHGALRNKHTALLKSQSIINCFERQTRSGAPIASSTAELLTDYKQITKTRARCNKFHLRVFPLAASKRI